MTRREIRENIFKVLFRIDFHDQESFVEQIALFKEEFCDMKESDLAYIENKCLELSRKLDEIDEKINASTTRWKTSRMNKVDLAIIRLAVYEMDFEEDIPSKVSINEAVELAKKYGTDESASFVNGVLAKFVC